MKKNRLSKNYILQFVYQFIVLLIPLIIAPYLVRILGETNLGIFSYVKSITYYFTLLAMLGILKYGQRLVAQNVHDDVLLRRKFWSLFVLHIITSAFSIMLYLFFVLVFINDNETIYYIFVIYVFSITFDVTWFFFGIEDFKTVIFVNTIIKVLESFLIFIFVTHSDDLYVYALIISMTTLASNVVLFSKIFRYVKPIRIQLNDIKEHIKPVLLLAVSVLAISLYTVFDKILLGLLTNIENVAYYEYSNKIINIPKIFISVIGTVMYPRSCDMIKKNDIAGQRLYYKISIIIVYFISFGSIFGLLAIGKDFATIYYGDAFSITGSLIMAMSPIILIIGIGEIIRMQYLIPSGKDNIYVLSVTISAIINIVISVLLIPILGVYGVIVGTIIAETFGLLFQIIVSKEYIDFKYSLKNLLAFIIISATMYFSIVHITNDYTLNIMFLIMIIVFGAGTYIILIFIYLLLFEKNIVKFVLNTFKK